MKKINRKKLTLKRAHQARIGRIASYFTSTSNEPTYRHHGLMWIKPPSNDLFIWDDYSQHWVAHENK